MNPLVHLPWSQTPAELDILCLSGFSNVVPASQRTRTSAIGRISELYPTAFALTAYASHSGIAPAMRKTRFRWLADLSGQDLIPCWVQLKSFRSRFSADSSSFLRLSLARFRTNYLIRKSGRWISGVALPSTLLPFAFQMDVEIVFPDWNAPAIRRPRPIELGIKSKGKTCIPDSLKKAYPKSPIKVIASEVPLNSDTAIVFISDPVELLLEHRV